MVRCEKCGYKNPDGSTRCEHCNEALYQEDTCLEQKNYVPAKRKRKGAGILVGICIVVLAAAAVAGAVLIRGSMNQKRYREQLAYGDKYLESGEFSEAEEAYLLALEVDERSEDAYIRLCRLYTQRGDLELAGDILNRGIKITDSQRLKTLLALLLVKQPEDESALETLESLTVDGIKEVSGSPEINISLIQKLKNYTYKDYKVQFGGTTEEREDDGIVKVSCEDFEGSLYFQDTKENSEVVDETIWKPFQTAVPNYISLEDISMLLQNYPGSSDYETLRMMNGGKIKKEYSEEAQSTVVVFTYGECEIYIASDEEGNITGSKIWNRIYPLRDGLQDDNKGHVIGVIVDAVTGKGIPSASLSAKPTGAGSTVTWTTESDGSYEIDLEEGQYEIKVQKEGYIEDSFAIEVEKGQQNDAGTVSLSPVLEKGEIRIVLSWGAAPRDLDSYLDGMSSDGNSVFVNFISPIARHSSKVCAELDLDDLDGYGPETITIYDTDGEYDYFVHDFNRTGTIGGCKATVKIYLPGQSPVEYVVPEGSGNRCNVCHISNGQVTPVNTIDNPQYSSLSK